ncbi:acetyl-CoA carboxylase biotin carboxyl carrier protein [Bacillus sp. UNC438CL73TsuS30]|uniref:acetyl-CoA carboxylase biotin carboxyl carrier protein n=1 Tax=Bacillus sp. UNC438CL73TsuS30 TaxID=1340434 RepID=UPI00047B1971|nr:biotin/lipoyl-containing protein [Bacillus sp. UNC438CL73TsuS30]
MTKNLFDGLNDIENITTLLEKLDESSFNYLNLESKDFKIVIGKNGVVESSAVQAVKEQAAQQASVVEIPAIKEQFEEAAVALEQPVQEKPAVSKPAEKDSDEGVFYIKAAMTGLFYAQPEPGAAPYVKVGDKIENDTTVGLIEIMKVYSAIMAGVTGEVTEILVEDSQLVEYGQPLLAVKVK